VTLKEPNKAELLPYFLQDLPPPTNIALNRKAFVNVINPLTQQAYEVVVDLLRKSVESVLRLPKEIQPPYAMDEEVDVEPIVLRDEGVQLRLGDLGINNISSVVTSFWLIEIKNIFKMVKWHLDYHFFYFVYRDFGYAGDRPEYFGKRIAQVFFFMKSFQEDNFFGIFNHCFI
jgi:Cu2+-containing amine oxidase